MHIRDLTPGQQFRFSVQDNGAVWEYRGSGWYGWPYSGGPYRADDNAEVVLLAEAEYVDLEAAARWPE